MRTLGFLKRGCANKQFFGRRLIYPLKIEKVFKKCIYNYVSERIVFYVWLL